MNGIIADSGSTGTAWVLVQGGTLQDRFYSQGLNPHFTADAEYLEVFQSVNKRWPDAALESVVFYGSGISGTEIAGRVKALLSAVFPTDQLEVAHDLLGAARAVCQRQPGIAVILGTGANTCVYNGTQITQNVRSLGYILGDEGSGAEIGKRWMKRHLSGTIDERLAAAFSQWIGRGPEAIIAEVYGGEKPNRFLASVMPFLSEHRHEPEVLAVLNEAFDALFDLQLKHYAELLKLPVHFVGSVAYHFRDILQEQCMRRNVIHGTFLADPIDALVDYHHV